MTPGRNEACPCGSGKKYKHCHGGSAGQGTAAPPAGALSQGALLLQQGRPAEAEQALRLLTRSAPEQAAGHALLGLALLLQGRAQEAVAALQRALALAPDDAAAYANLGAALKHLDRFDEAEQALRQALARDASIASAHSNLGVLLMRRHDPAALASFNRALALEPRFADAHFNLASQLREQGLIGASTSALRRVIVLAPDRLPAWNNLLLGLLYADDMTPEAVFGWHRHFNTLLGHLQVQAATSHANPPRPARRLRVGLLSPDLRRHSVAYFVAPLLQHHDRAAIEFVCYHDHPLEDGFSAQLKALAASWVNTAALDDTALAALIGHDGIDVLIDLAGHTGLRMPVLARKPAPLQAMWLGYPASTGLTAIDFRITDAQADPPGREALHSERLLRLPDSYFCYRPPEEAPEPVPPPCMRQGHITFGSFNQVAKLSPTTLALWARVLQAVPASRLLLKAAGLADASVCERLAAALAALGIEPGRVVFRSWEAQGGAHLAAYGEIDIALDTTPYNGATTTCEALWMGVPVVSLAGDRSQARMGDSILSAAGHAEWVAHDADGFVARAAALAADTAALRAWRHGARAQLCASPLLDGPRFARGFEACLHTIWQGRGLSQGASETLD